MTDSRFPLLLEEIEWNIVGRGQIFPTFTESGIPRPIPAQFFNITNSRLLAIGIGTVQSNPTWKYAGLASQCYDFTFGPFSSVFKTFPSIVQSHKLRLFHFNICVFDMKLPQWKLMLDVPYWFKDVTYEIWRYDGLESDLYEQIERLSQYIVPQ